MLFEITRVLYNNFSLKISFKVSCESPADESNEMSGLIFYEKYKKDRMLSLDALRTTVNAQILDGGNDNDNKTKISQLWL